MGSYVLYLFEVGLIVVFLTEKGSEKGKFTEQVFCILSFPGLILDEQVTKKLRNFLILRKENYSIGLGLKYFPVPLFFIEMKERQLLLESWFQK